MDKTFEDRNRKEVIGSQVKMKAFLVTQQPTRTTNQSQLPGRTY